MKRVFIDMDGVLADIHEKIGNYVSAHQTPPQILEKGFYSSLRPQPNAYETLQKLRELKELDFWVATKIPNENPYAATEKIIWLEDHFPFLSRKVFITPDKTFLNGDYLIDDDRRWEKFNGDFIHFNHRNPTSEWRRVRHFLEGKVNNSMKLGLSVYALSLVLHNRSNTGIRKLVYHSFSDELTDEGSVISCMEPVTLYDIAPGTSLVLVDNYLNNNANLDIKYIEWDDGEIQVDRTLSTYRFMMED